MRRARKMAVAAPAFESSPISARAASTSAMSSKTGRAAAVSSHAAAQVVLLVDMSMWTS